MKLKKRRDMRGTVPESWACIDCGVNTAPAMLNRAQLEQAFANDWTGKASVRQEFNHHTEVYTVKRNVWQAAGVGPMDGCLCIGCLEKRIGRELTGWDFLRNHALNQVMAGTARLLDRRWRR